MSESELQEPVKLRLRPLNKPVAPVSEISRAQAIKLRVLELLKQYMLAVIVVGVPVFLTIIYEEFIASDIYVSEAHFIVRSKAMASSGALSGLSATSSLNPLSSMSQQSDITQAVNDYLASRDIISALIQNDNLSEALSRPEADFLSRFPRFFENQSIEALYRRLSSFIYAYFSDSTGISTLYVYAYRPADAQRIAAAALLHAEDLINRLNARQQKDSIAFAQEMVSKAETKVKEVQQQISDFRNTEKLYDPIRQGASTIDLISKMNSDVAQLRAELSEVIANSPASPKVVSIKARIAAVERQIVEQQALITGGDKSLAPKLAVYERLMLERDLAGKVLSSTLASLETAIKDADLQRLYLQKVVEPNLPDYALYPRRNLTIVAVLGLFLCVYWLISIIGEAILEHDA
jgi:capsular polysaccharide transport system permease protein